MCNIIIIRVSARGRRGACVCAHSTRPVPQRAESGEGRGVERDSEREERDGRRDSARFVFRAAERAKSPCHATEELVGS